MNRKLIRTPIKFKQYPIVVRLFQKVGDPVEAKKAKEAQSLISMVLLSNSKLNPAQKESLRKAKDLLHVK